MTAAKTTEHRKRRIEDAEDAAAGGAEETQRKGTIEDETGDAEPIQTDGDGRNGAADEASQRSRPQQQRPVTPEKKPPQSASPSQQLFSPELLRAYYSRLFPYDLLTGWLSYEPPAHNHGTRGDTESATSDCDLLSRREFSFTLEPTLGEEIYVRYQSFRSTSDLSAAVKRRNPTKIDIGAVFSHCPKDKSAIPSGQFRTEQRELVFDIDLTDYDDVRNCGCDGAKICPKCWTMMSMAVKVMDRGLREDFGYRHVAWFYSGRRGVHAWVCDKGARMLSNEGRSAVASYFEVSMGNDKNKNMSLPHPLHPTLSSALDILEPMFVRYILPSSGHGLLASREMWDELLGSLPDGAKPVADRLGRKWNAPDAPESTPAEKWEELKRNLDILVGRKGKGGGGGSNKAAKKLSAGDRIKIEQWPTKTVLRHCYPRLDINVSKMQNHLLKSPFCVHPKTGRVCVPIDASKVEAFDPFDVPTLPRLMRELDEREKEERRAGATSGNDLAEGVEEGKAAKRKTCGRDGYDGMSPMGDWRKTSLQGPFEHFQREFLYPLWTDLRNERRSKSEEEAAATGDF